MSVTTPADKEIREALDHVQKAITHLCNVVVDQTDGADQFKPHYKEKLRQALNTLIRVRDDL